MMGGGRGERQSPAPDLVGGSPPERSFQFGNAKLNERGYACCGKPRGCRMTHEGCAYLRHPWKRAMVFGDTTARCQATRINPDTHEQEQCVLNHGHAGACDPEPTCSRSPHPEQDSAVHQASAPADATTLAPAQPSSPAPASPGEQ